MADCVEEVGFLARRGWLSNYYPLIVDGDVLGVNVVVQEITDLKRGEERQLSLEALLANMTEGFAMCDAIWGEQGDLADYTIVEMNAALQRMLKVGPDAVGTKLSDTPGDRTDWLRLCDRVLKTGEPASFEVQNSGLERWYEVRVTRVTESRMAQLFFDITERKRAEAHQGELFDELNHRVNNNLTLVSGVLRMKAHETDNDTVRDQLLRADSRVQSIAQVHKALYRGARKDAVDFGSYLQELCAGMQEALVRDDRIQVKVDAEPISLPVDTAIALGMVANELVTNAVKYAYSPHGTGLILVGLVSEGDGLRLSVRDFGRGLHEDGEARAGGGLGMKLVRSLVTQVNGELSITGLEGAAFEIKVPAPNFSASLEAPLSSTERPSTRRKLDSRAARQV